MGYLLLGSGTMLLLGRAAAVAGPRRMFLAGYAVFVVGALLCGLAPSLPLLVAARCLQGLGGAAMVVMTYSASQRLLPPSRLGGALGLLATAGALGVAVGSPLGGLLTESISWRAVFFVNVPVGLVAMAVAWRALPARAEATDAGPAGGARAPHADRRRLDFAGGALSFLAVTAFILWLDQGQTRGWASPHSVTLVALAAAAAVLFVVREGRAPDPLLAPALLRDRRFQLASGACVLGLVLMGGNALVMPFLLELLKGLSTSAAGLLLLTYSLTFMVVSPLAGRLADRHATRTVSAAGMAVGAAAATLFALTAGTPGVLTVVVFLLALAVAYGLFMPANSKQVMEAPPPEHRGAAPAVLATLNSLSLLLGAAAFETLLTNGRAVTDATAAAATRTVEAAGGAWTAPWVPGFSPAYLVGAGACAAALVLVLAGRHTERP